MQTSSEIGRVCFSELAELSGEFVEHVDGVCGANRNTGSTIDAFLGMNVKMRDIIEAQFILRRMNAVDRACLHAQVVFGTAIGNNVRH
jgi:hypothetical protein